MAQPIAIADSGDLFAFAPEHFPECLSEVGIAQGVAQRVDCTIDVTQPVTWKHTETLYIITKT